MDIASRATFAALFMALLNSSACEAASCPDDVAPTHLGFFRNWDENWRVLDIQGTYGANPGTGYLGVYGHQGYPDQVFYYCSSDKSLRNEAGHCLQGL